jgi:ribosome-associated toxin RatA of RatAB toxin-antitoxin module
MGTIDGQSTAEIDAPIERVWDLVQDVERGPQWQGGMKTLTGVERDGDERVLLADVEVDAKVRSLYSQVRFTYQSPSRLSWVQERGQLKSVVGSWELSELDGGARTQATYKIKVDLGRLGLVIRGPILGILRAELAGARAGELKRAIETG